MPSPDTLDFAKLLAPIPGEKPAGADLRADSAPGSSYYAIKDARNAARAAERRLEAADDEERQNATPPDWKAVLQHATKALAEKSKDLEIAAYLIEAQARLKGFAGLRDGFRLARELSEQFWDGIYPLPDEEGVETRVAALTGLNGEDSEGTLIAPISRIPITESDHLTLADYRAALNTAKIADPKVREKKVAAGAMTMEALQKAVNETPAKFYAALYEDLNLAIEEFGKLGAEMDKRCGPKAPPTSAIRAALTAVLDCLKDVARAKLPAPKSAAPEADAAADGEPAANGEAKAAGHGVPVGEIRSREDALNQLMKVADFFRRTEPHTPVSYAIEQAVRWGRMTLPELLQELIPDDAPRKGFFKQVGIAPPEPPPKEEAKKK